MYFDRKRIKEIAKFILKRRHWIVVLAVFLTALLGGYVGGVATNVDISLPFTDEDTSYDDSYVYDDGYYYDDDYYYDDGGIYNPWEDYEDDVDPRAHPGTWDAFWADLTEGIAEEEVSLFLTVFFTILIIVIVVVLAWQIFMGNAMTVGGHGWLLRYWRGETLSIGDLFAAFRIYKPAVWTMFVKDLYVFLWSLLFVIPGIIKGYAYSMVPYIIYENPNLTADQAIKMSEKMTDGYKGELFVFNLSYLGWQLLSAITGGLVGILYSNPYQGVAHAGVYEDLKWKAIQSGRLTWEDFGQTPPPAAQENPACPYPPYDPQINAQAPYTSPAGQYVSPAGQYPPPAGQYPPPAGQYPPPAGQYPPPAGQYPPPAGQYPPPAGQYPPPAGQYPPPAGQYAPPAGQYPPPAGQYAPPAGQYPPPAGQYPPPAGQYPPPAGQYPPPAGQYPPPPPPAPYAPPAAPPEQPPAAPQDQ